MNRKKRVLYIAAAAAITAAVSAAVIVGNILADSSAVADYLALPDMITNPPRSLTAACVSLIRLVMRESPRRLPRGLHLSCRSHGI